MTPAAARKAIASAKTYDELLDAVEQSDCLNDEQFNKALDARQAAQDSIVERVEMICRRHKRSKIAGKVLAVIAGKE